jgi:hypothetical protein
MMLRVHFKEIDSESEGRDDYTFDIQVEAENKPVGGIPFFGLWGQFSDDQNCYPALLRKDGQIDLGNYEHLDPREWNRDDRFQRTNLRDRPMVLGEFVTFWIHDHDSNQEEAYTYKISHIHKL